MRKRNPDGDRGKIRGAKLTAKVDVGMVAGKLAWRWKVLVYRNRTCVARVESRFCETTSSFAADAAIAFCERCNIDTTAVKAALAKVQKRGLPAHRSPAVFKH